MEFLYVIALLSTGVWSEQIHVIGRTNGEKISFDISLEEDFMIALTGRQPDPPQANYKQSINFYDFEKHLEARKLSDENICFIRPFVATYEQTRLILENATLSASKETDHVSEDLTIEGEEILVDQLGEVVGEKIADFCEGSRVVWALQEAVLQHELEPVEEHLQGQEEEGISSVKEQDDEQPTAVIRSKRSPQLDVDVDANNRGYTGRVRYNNNRWTGSLQGEYGRDGSYGGQLGLQYRGRHGSGGGSFGYHSQRGYQGSLNYRNGRVDANAGFNYHRRNGWGVTAGVRIRF